MNDKSRSRVYEWQKQGKTLYLLYLIQTFSFDFRDDNSSKNNIDKFSQLKMSRVPSREDVQMRQQVPKLRNPRYPALNIYSSPRVFQQKINHRSRPLCIYTGPISANNLTKFYDRRTPQDNYLREINPSDGLLHQFYRMNDPKLSKAIRQSVDGQQIRREPLPNPIPQPFQALGVKVLICICMYNQSKNAINLTLSGIYDNLPHLEAQGISPEEVGVVLLQDGILKLVQDRKIRSYAKGKNSMVQFYRELDRLDGKPRCDLEERINVILDEIDNFQKREMGDHVAKNCDFPPTIEKNISLLYQNLWNPGMTDEEKRLQAQLTGEPFKYNLKLFSCFKHMNGTKLSSHLWFFEGFCRYLNPTFIVLLDVGTQPNEEGLVNLLRGFYNRNGTDNSTVGGVTGLMSIDNEFPSQEGGDGIEEEQGFFKRTFFSIERAQEYEYIISHFIDKNAESSLGFLHVLPGAWSAYRYKALIKSENYEPNLLEHSYFKMTLNPDMECSGYEQANMYLAEDRILSLGIYCQPGSKYYLKYVPDAGARTDPMKSHEDLMKQRRRWINSSLFAFLYVFKNYSYNASESTHGAFDRYVTLNLSMILAMLSFATSYFIPSLYFYVLYATVSQINPGSQLVQILALVLALIYVIIYLIAIAGGLSGSVWTKHAQSISKVFAVITFAMIGLVTYNVIGVYLGVGQGGIDVTNFNQMSILVMCGVNIGGYFLIILVHLCTHTKLVWKLFADVISYWFYQGAYMQTMVAHAFCNVDDVSWGTKGSTTAHGGKTFENDKVFFVSGWVFWNAIMAYLCIYVDVVIAQPNLGPQANRKYVLIVIALYGTAQMFIRLVLALGHHLWWMLTQWSPCCRGTLEQHRIKYVTAMWKKINQDYRLIEDGAMMRSSLSTIHKKIGVRGNANGKRGI